MQRLSKAIALAATVHEGQFDKAGEPYILHSLAVMNLVQTGGRFVNNPHDREALLCAAVLHDVIEDFEGGPGEKHQLRDRMYADFGDRCYAAVDRLTRLPDDDYHKDYIERVALDWISRRVKIADLTHNMDPRRLPARNIGEKDYQRWEKYRRAIVRLERED
jgi:(p)ppGpp synthase/HD superfamily hydrolase